MSSKKLKMLAVTANTGSLFEEHGMQLQKNWISEFKKTVQIYNPGFLAIHFQEVGGKTNVVCLETVTGLLDELCNVLDEYVTVRNFIDQDYSDEQYTAIGSCYFIHKLFTDAEMYNFEDQTYSSLENGKMISSMSKSSYIRKSKFPMSCFSKNITRWPRKGFTWTKWRFLNKTFDLVNVHLPHDACNVTAATKSNSKYAKYRRRTLEYIIERLKEDPADHQVLFGDFNVRLNTKSIVEHITLNSERQLINDDTLKTLKYTTLNSNKEDILLIETRRFEPNNYDMFRKENVPNLIYYDQELDWFKDEHDYKELDIQFMPSYPHKEDPSDTTGETFAPARCPSWCDRILMDNGLHSVLMEKHTEELKYDITGEDVIVGDHKPVYLSFQLEI